MHIPNLDSQVGTYRGVEVQNDSDAPVVAVVTGPIHVSLP